MKKRLNVRISLLSVVALTSCGRPPEPAIAQHEAPLSVPGIERVIPVEFLVLDDFNNPCPTQVTTQPAAAVAVANQVYLAAGIQFALAGVKRYNVPLFRDLNNNGNQQLAWSAVQSQLALIDPTVASWTPPASPETNDIWTQAIATRLPKNAIHVFVGCTDNVSNGGGHSAYPSWDTNTCAGSWCGDWSHLLHVPAVQVFAFPHEVGHYLGLRHTFSILPPPGPPGNDYGPDPLHADSFYFDLLYGVTNNNTVVPFTSQAQAQAWNQSPLYMKDYASCGVSNTSTCDLKCTLDNQTFYTSTAGSLLNGLAFTYKPNETYGINVMSYLLAPGCRQGLSNTQMARVRESIRSSTGSRQLLGRYSNPLSPAIDARKPLDFDGDGKPDLAFWRGSDKSCHYVGSIDGVEHVIAVPSADPTLGDVPVPDDYTGDGLADCAVYRPAITPSDSGTWYWSYPTGPGTTGCCSEDTFFGTMGAVPLTGLKFRQGNNVSFNYGFYTPTDAMFHMRMQGAPELNVQFGVTGDQLMLGDWDHDGYSDLAVWRLNGTSSILSVAPSSINSLNTYLQIINLTFGNDTDVPLPGVDKDGNGWLDLGVYRPSSGTWFYFLNPASLAPGSYVWSQFASSRRPSQQWGISTDRVFPGFSFEGAGSLVTDEVVYRPSVDVTTGGWFYVHQANGTYRSIGLGAMGDQPFVSNDLDGDGLPEVWVYRPNEGKWFEVPSAGGGYPYYYLRFWGGEYEDIPL